MRLNKTEVEAIKEVTRSVFGENATVRVFGSRTDDHLKGGDIDLFVQCNRVIGREERYQLKLRYLVQLKNRIGDQKIDVLIEYEQFSNPVFETLRQKGIQL